MPYYPKSQILPNQKTNGKELILASNREPYKGDYYKLSNGETFTGKTPSDGPNLKLIPTPIDSPFSNYNTPSDPFESEGISPLIAEQDKNFYRATLNKNYFDKDNSFIQRKSPSKSFTLPTEKDYELGIFKRYFCKKNNELKYFEIDKETCNLLKSKNSSIAFDLYSTTELMWYLKGEKEQVFTLNKKLSESIEKKKKWFGFSQYFKNNFSQFYQQPPTQENLYTNGGEFKTPDGKEYIGSYHIHPEKGAMVGAIHTKKKHNLLTPINPIMSTQISSSQLPSNPPINPGGGYSSGGGY